MNKQDSRVMLALAVAVWAVGIGLAQAAPVRHDNLPGPAHFDWSPELNGPAMHLDIMLAASAQPNPNAHSISQELYDGFSMISGGSLTMTGGSDGLFVLDVPAGTTIGPATPWVDTTGWIQFDTESELAEGIQIYLAFQFDPGDGVHYGWVGVERSGFELDAFAWGFEIVAGVPIAAGVPEPGTLALFAFGAVGLAFRRRRQHA